VRRDCASDRDFDLEPKWNIRSRLQPAQFQQLTGCDRLRSRWAAYQKILKTEKVANNSRVFNDFRVWQRNCSPSKSMAKADHTENKALSKL